MLTTLMLSFGVPLLPGGDEMGRTHRCSSREIAGRPRRRGHRGADSAWMPLPCCKNGMNEASTPYAGRLCGRTHP